MNSLVNKIWSMMHPEKKGERMFILGGDDDDREMEIRCGADRREVVLSHVLHDGTIIWVVTVDGERLRVFDEDMLEVYNLMASTNRWYK